MAENAEPSTVPVSTSLSGVRPPWAMAMPNTTTAAPSAPTRAPAVSARVPSELNKPMVITAVAPTLAPEEMPSR